MVTHEIARLLLILRGGGVYLACRYSALPFARPRGGCFVGLDRWCQQKFEGSQIQWALFCSWWGFIFGARQRRTLHGSIERLRGMYCFCHEKFEGSPLLMTVHPREAVLAGLLGFPPLLPDRC